jgi:hypothetical protein
VAKPSGDPRDGLLSALRSTDPLQRLKKVRSGGPHRAGVGVTDRQALSVISTVSHPQTREEASAEQQKTMDPRTALLATIAMGTGLKALRKVRILFSCLRSCLQYL